MQSNEASIASALNFVQCARPVVPCRKRDVCGCLLMPSTSMRLAAAAQLELQLAWLLVSYRPLAPIKSRLRKSFAEALTTF